MADKNSYSVASVQVWGKGYRVSADSEEFQRYVPVVASEERGLESKLVHLPWGRILEPLYALTERELSLQRCLLFDASELMAVSFARTEDRHRRPSLVLVTATARIEWDDSNIGETAARTVTLANRLASAYAEAFLRNPESIGGQLKSNAFLPSRVFELSDEAPDSTVEWAQVLSAVRRWRGIFGVATARLLSVGGNVVLGTKFEAERAQAQFAVDGFFDVREKDIKPLSSRLSKWEQPIQVRVPEPMTGNAAPAGQDLRPIAEALDRIDRRLEKLVDIAVYFVELAFRGDKRRK